MAASNVNVEFSIFHVTSFFAMIFDEVTMVQEMFGETHDRINCKSCITSKTPNPNPNLNEEYYLQNEPMPIRYNLWHVDALQSRDLPALIIRIILRECKTKAKIAYKFYPNVVCKPSKVFYTPYPVILENHMHFVVRFKECTQRSCHLYSNEYVLCIHEIFSFGRIALVIIFIAYEIFNITFHFTKVYIVCLSVEMVIVLNMWVLGLELHQLHVAGNWIVHTLYL